MADKQCNRCGYINPATRGACLMCYYYLDGDDAGVPYVGEAAPTDIVASALALLESTGGVIEDDDSIGPGPAYADEEEEDMTEEEAAAFAEFKAQQASLRDDALGVPAGDDEDDEEGAFMAPSALALEQSAAGDEVEAVPALNLDDAMAHTAVAHPHEAETEPDPDEVELETGLSFEDAAPAEPAPEVEEAELAPPPPMDGFGFDDGIDFSDSDALDETAMAPPVPTGLGGFDDEEQEAAPEPAAAPPATEKTEEAETDEESLGGWSLEFDEEK